jgi:predicted nucleic acid-binding protein
VIVLDANVLIALLDKHDAHHAAAAQLMLDTPPPYAVHALTLAEVLVGPARRGVEEEVLRDLADIGVKVDGEREDEALRLARLRAQHRLKMPDTCVLSVADRFQVPLVTFDGRLADVADGSALLYSAP